MNPKDSPLIPSGFRFGLSTFVHELIFWEVHDIVKRIESSGTYALSPVSVMISL